MKVSVLGWTEDVFQSGTDQLHCSDVGSMGQGKEEGRLLET